MLATSKRPWALLGSVLAMVVGFTLPSEAAAAAVPAEREAQARALLEEALRAVPPPLSEAGGRADASWKALREIAVALARAGDEARAKQVAHNLPSHYSTDALKGIAVAQAEGGEFPKAARTAEEISDPKTKTATMLGIGLAQARLGDAPGARRMAAGMRDEWDASRILLEVARAQSRAGNIVGARQTMIAIPMDSYRVLALADLAVVQGKADNVIGASRILQEAFQAYYQARGGNLYETALELVMAQAQVGDTKRAMETAKSFRGRQHDDALVRIMLVEAEKGNEGNVLQAADAIEWDYLRFVTLAAAARILGPRGHIPAARRIAAGLPDFISRSLAFAGVAMAEAEAGDKEAARAAFKEAQLWANFEGQAGFMGLRQEVARVGAWADLQAALEWARQEPEPLMKAYTLLGIAEGLLDPAPPLRSPGFDPTR